MAAYDGLHFELGIRNLSGLVANFRAVDETLQADIRALVLETAIETRDLTEILAAKRTGFMAEHLLFWLTNSGLGFEVGWDATDFLDAGYAFYPFFVEFGTRYMAAQPALGPAWDSMQPQFVERMSVLLRAAAARAGRGT